MNRLSSLRVRLVGIVFLAAAPSLGLMLYTKMVWPGLAAGLLALVAAWFGGDVFILRQVKALLQATKRLGTGDLSSRTGLTNEPGELGQLAQAFDQMAASLERQVKEREQAEAKLVS